MTVVRAFLFDLDGTLVDTREANYLAYREAFARYDHDLTPAEFETTWGRDSRDFVPELVPHLSADEVLHLRAAKGELYERHLGSTHLNIELVGFLSSVMDGQNTALVTTAKTRNARTVLDYHGLTNKFAVVVAGEDVAISKPDPSCYVEALTRLGVPAKEALAFEDSESGMSAAAAAGITVVRVEAFT